MEDQRTRTEVTVTSRTALRLLGIAAAFVGVLYFLWLVRGVLLLVLLGVFLALALNPLVNGVQARFTMRRGPAVALVFGLTVLALISFLAAILAPLYSEVQKFIDNVPQYIEELQRSRAFKDLDQRYDVLEKIREASEELPSRLPDTAPALLGVAGRVVSAVFDTITVLFLALFVLLEMPAITNSLLSLLSPPQAERARTIGVEINSTVARYVAGNFAISLIAGAVTYVTLSILGVPFAVVLALLVAVFDLIPLVGATIGLAIVVLVSFTQGVEAGVIMLIVGIVYQQLENQVIQPVVMKHSVKVSPLIVIISVLIGAALLGVLGALLAIPVAGSIQIALREVIETRRARVAAQHAALAAMGAATDTAG